MADHENTYADEFSAPDWEFGTDDDLRAHAAEAVKNLAQSLEALSNHKDRPTGTIANSVLQLPAPDADNIARQVCYLGYIAENCRRNALLVRGIGTSEGPDGGVSVLVALCTQADFLRAELENEQGERFIH